MMSNITPPPANPTIPGSPSKKKKPIARRPPKGAAAATHGTLHELVDSTIAGTHTSHYTQETHTSSSHSRPPLRMSVTSTNSTSSSSGTSSATSGLVTHHFTQGPSGGGRSLSTSGGSGAGPLNAGLGASYRLETAGERGSYYNDNHNIEVEEEEDADDLYRENRSHRRLHHNSTDRQHGRQRRRRHDSNEFPSSDTVRKPGLYGKAHIKGRFKLVRMVLLTTSLMGLQFTWAVEMAYGTPFLLQLGLSKSLMSLVWLAGPLSGLVMQPIVGVLSDRCTSRFGRRRPFLVVGVAAVVLSFLCLGWCREIMAFIFGHDYEGLDVVTILMAVVSIYILDFAINCVQASCRTLIVDSLPSSQQEEAAAWASRLMGLGGIFGYFMGNVNLPEIVPAFGDTQIKGLCIVACLFLILNVGLTCWAVTERVMVRTSSSPSSSTISEFLGGFKSIFQSIRHLPLQIQRLCNVQFFAWMGWFPFLFYSSTYIAEIYLREMEQHQPEGGQDGGTNPEAPATGELNDAAVRAGSYCLLVYSIVSLAASILLPVFVAPAMPSHQQHHHSASSSTSPTTPSSARGRWFQLFDSQDGRSSSNTLWQQRWQQLKPRWLVLPIPWLTLPRMYTLSLGLLSLSLLMTWVLQDIRGSTILFSLCGIAWAVSMWAPFSILGEVISQQLQEQQHQERMRGSHGVGLGHGVETMFDAGAHLEGEDDDGEDEDGDDDESHLLSMQGVVVEGEEGEEEIRMVEHKRYRPVAVHVDLSSFDSPPLPPPAASTRNTQGQTISELARSRNGTSAVLDVETADGPWDHHHGGGGRSHLYGSSSLASIDTVVSETDKEGSTKYHHTMEEIQVHEDGRDSIEEETLEGDGDGDEAQKLVQTHRGEGGGIESTRGRAARGGSGGGEVGSATSSVGTSAGALLGIHNIYIVLPQFLVSFLSSLVFAAIESGKAEASEAGGDAAKAGVTGIEGEQPADPNTIGVMLRFGGLMAGIAAFLSLRLWRAPAFGGRW